MSKEKENISLEWFKAMVSESMLKTITQLANEGIRPECPTHNITENEYSVVSPKEKLYSQLRVIGDTITVVLKNGTILSKSNSGKTEFDAIRVASSEEEIFNIANEVLGSKLIWDKYDNYQAENQHRRQVHNYSMGYDLVLSIDADEKYIDDGRNVLNSIIWL